MSQPPADSHQPRSKTGDNEYSLHRRPVDAYRLTMGLHSEPILGDAFGQALIAELASGSGTDHHLVERSDGYINELLHSAYFTEEPDWPAVDQACLDRAHGKILDVGAGAGRATLAAQERGFEVTALDVSAGAIEVCRRRGCRDTFEGTLEDLVESGVEDSFDTFLMLGNNIGILGGPARAATIFGTISRLGTDDARIVGTIGHIYKTDQPQHFRYHDLNRSLGRMAGELRLRVRYGDLASEWFDYLFASPEELAEIAADNGWKLTDIVEDEGFVYMAELRRA